jgi:hypothetical protein
MRTRLKTYGKIHFSELDPMPQGIILMEEWETYRRAVPRRAFLPKGMRASTS